MATLSTLISRLPIEWRARYDFTSFWISKCNDLLDEISQIVDMPDNQKECGVEVSNNYVITPPPDYRRALDVYVYGNSDRKYPFSEREGRIVLKDSYSKDSSSTSIALHDWTTTKVLANIASAADNAYVGKLLVLTNGDGLSGDAKYSHIISDSTIPGSGVLELFFEYPLASAYSTCSAGYLATLFLMLSYVRRYTVLTASGDEVNLADKFEKALIAGLSWKCQEDMGEGNAGETQRAFQMWQYELGLLGGRDSENASDSEPRQSYFKEAMKYSLPKA